jgi:hypothetical protein
MENFIDPSVYVEQLNGGNDSLLAVKLLGLFKKVILVLSVYFSFVILKKPMKNNYKKTKERAEE